MFILSFQVKMLRKTIALDPEIRRKLVLLKLITFLSPLLATMRKKMMKIPKIDELYTSKDRNMVIET